jgi:hypothetical protein
METTTNNTTAPKYLNEHGYSDVTPWEVVRVVSATTVEIRCMAAELAPDWKPQMVVGGFSAVAINNNSQRWQITPNPAAPVIRARLTKNGWWKIAGCSSRFIAADKPARFFDYNF